MIEKNTIDSSASSLNLPRILISILMLNSLVLLSFAPVIAANPETSLNQPTQPKTQLSTEGNQTETIPDKEDTPTIPDVAPPEEAIEPEATETEKLPNEDNEETSTTSENTTQNIRTDGSIANTQIQSNDSSSFSSSELSDEERYNPTVQHVTISVIPSEDTANTTDVNFINVTTTQSYETITAEISISDTKPSYAPPIILKNEHDFIDSYLTVQFAADNNALTEEQIQSMTMTLKIKKNPDDHASLRDAQIYVLTYEANPLFSLSQTLNQETIAPFSSSRWQPIAPIEITEDDDYVYYHIETPSYYATFAIVGTELVEIQPYQTGIPQIPWAAIVLTIILSTVLLVFVLFKTDFIYQVEDSAADKKNEKSFKQTNQKWSYKVKLSAIRPELQLNQPPAAYFSTTPCAPQILTASTQLQDSSDECEEDPMYL